MAMRESDLLSTPEGYATPEQLKAAREYYGTLLKTSASDKPIINKWQGISRMVDALVGGIGANHAAMQERAARRGAAADSIPDTGEGSMPGVVPSGPTTPRVGGANYMTGVPNPSNLVPGKTSSSLEFSAHKAAMPSMQGFLDDLIAAGAPIKQVGSYNDRNIAGTNTKSQHAYGNAIDLNQSGRNTVSPEFLAWARANEPKLAELEKKHNMISGGNWSNPDFGHWEWGGPPKGGGALAFNGEPTNVPQVGSPDSMATALAPGGGATFPMPKSLPTEPGGNNALIPPGVFQQRPRMSREQLQRLLANPYADPSFQQLGMQTYLQQNQPVQFEGTGGTWVMGRDGQPHFIPKTEWVPEKAGSVETKSPFQWNPKKGQYELVPMGGGTPPQITKPPAPQDVPNLNFAAGEPGKGMLDTEGLPPEILTGQSAPKLPEAPELGPEAGSGMLNFAPPDDASSAISNAIAPKPAAKAGTEGKTAQISPRLQSLVDYDMEVKQREEAAKKEADSYQKKYDTATQVGQRAQASRSMLEMARKLIDDPQYYSGIGGDAVIDWKRIKTALGIDPTSSTANEAFDKIISGQLLEDMKISLQGLGQVRVAEIDLLRTAAANRHMSPPANKLVLDLMLKAHDKAANVGKITAGYEAGARWDKDGKVIRDKDGAVTVHGGAKKLGELDGVINRYLDKNPILTEKEQDQLKEAIRNPSGYGMPPKPERSGKYVKERPEPKFKPAEKQVPTGNRIPATQEPF